MKIAWIPAVLFIGIATLCWMGLSRDPHALSSPLIGKTIPNFSLPNLSDPHQRLTNEIFKGHVTLLNVFATWCVTCRAEHPILMDIARQSDVQLIGLDYKDQPTDARKWLAQFGNPYQYVIVDEQGRWAIDLGVYGTPESFIVDKDGIIRYKRVGAITRDVWQNELLPVIKSL